MSVVKTMEKEERVGVSTRSSLESLGTMQLATLWKMPMTGKTANDALSRAQLYLRPVFYILFLVIQSEGSSHI